jgi:hypothetical protein
MLYKLSKSVVQGFTTNMSGSDQERVETYKDVVASLLALILAIVIIGFVGKFLWNATMPELFSFAKPVKSCWQIIGLMILVSLFR